MFFTDKKITKNYYSFFKELTINIVLFFVFQTIVLFQEDLSIIKDSKEISFAGLFSLFSIFYLLYLNISGKHVEYHLEKINFFLLSTNLMFAFAFFLHILNAYFLESKLEITNFYYINLFLLGTSAFMLIFLRYRNMNEYLIGAMSDIMLKNVAYKKLKLNHRAVARKSIRINKDLSDENVISHEVGHLLFILPYIAKNKDVLISTIPDSGAKGFVLTNLFESPKTKLEFERKMLYLVGGLAADYYEQSKTGTDIEVGAASDMWKFSNLAASYLKNGFSKKMLFLGESSELTLSEVSAHNKACMDYIYQSILKECLVYIINNKEVYEEIKALLKEEKVLYTEDLLKYKDRLKGEIICDL